MFFEDPHAQAVSQSGPFCKMLASTDKEQRARVMLAYRSGKKDAMQIVTEMCLQGMLADSPACEPRSLVSVLRKAALPASNHNLLLLHYRQLQEQTADLAAVHSDLKRLQDPRLFRGPLGARSAMLYLMVAAASRYEVPPGVWLELTRLAAASIPEAVTWYVQALFQASQEIAYREDVRRYVRTLVSRQADRNRDVMLLQARLAGSGYLGYQGEQAAYYRALYREVARHMGATDEEAAQVDNSAGAPYNKEDVVRDAKRYIETRSPRHEPTKMDFEWSCPWQSVLAVQQKRP